MEGFEYPENPEWSIRADEKEGMLDLVNGVKRMLPILRFLQYISPIVKDSMRGFIAEEDGKPVGLINYMRQRDVPEWYIANVTVLPAYRGCGHARKLVEAVLEELHKRRASLAILEVVDGNMPAVKLYQKMGFEIFTDSVEMDLEAGAAIPMPILPEGWTLVPLSRFNWRTRFELAKRITPDKTANYEPPLEARFRMAPIRPLFGILFEKMQGSLTKRFAVRDPDAKITGFCIYRVRTRKGGTNSASIELDPAHPGLAPFLIAHAINTIQSLSPGRRIEFEFQNWQPALIQAAQALGCKKRMGAHRMGLKFA